MKLAQELSKNNLKIELINIALWEFQNSNLLMSLHVNDTNALYFQDLSISPINFSTYDGFSSL